MAGWHSSSDSSSSSSSSSSQFVERITQVASNVLCALVLAEQGVFSAALNLSKLRVGSWRLPGRQFQAIGSATENSLRPNLLPW